MKISCWVLLASSLSISDATPRFRLPWMHNMFRGGSTTTTIAPEDAASIESNSPPYVGTVNSTDGNSTTEKSREAAGGDDDNETQLQQQTPVSAVYNFSIFQPGDGHEEDPDGIPGRYLRMQKGNRQKSLKALKASLKWREENQVDTILMRPNPLFDLGKAVQPALFIGRDPLGHVIFVQRPGYLNHDLAAATNYDFHQLIMHYVYMLEYCWNIMEPRPDQTMTSILDLKDVSLKKTKEMLSFLKEFMSMMSAHYPQRSFKTLMINAPHWASMMYGICSPLLRESTRKKITMCFSGKRQEELLAEILGDDYPRELLTGEPITAELPMERQMRDFCVERLKESGVEMQPIPAGFELA